MAQGFGSVSPLVYSAPTQQDWRHNMFVETRTTVAEVIADIFKEVEMQANSVANEVHVFRSHPTLTSKASIRNSHMVLMGMVQLARRVSGGELPEDARSKVATAIEAVRSL